MEKYICIHGHFYQPPRENPWLEDVELQESAYPYHDWNERISAECYAPNTSARILNEKGWIKKIFNNYTKISFNFGPTLFDWLKTNEPEIYRAVIDADRASRQNFSGHGSAFAQAYNHIIMPLANRRDKYTQVIWGIKDFENHFSRHPEGMWLPETAVDLETLEIMADKGIKFTVLAPYQARRVRKIGSDAWEEVGPNGIDPTMPYQLRLPGSGKIINIFFYDGPISRAVAFEKLLNNGERFTHRLMDGFSNAKRPQLVNIATDGETYGHHHQHGEMALAYALYYIESRNLARITNYGEYLEKHPPTHEVEIKENTAWSCAHGVGRWQSDCGCNTGMHPEWNQAWRAPLRNALNWLRNTLAPRYEKYANQFLKDPWEARDDYIEVILDRSPENINRFLAKHAGRELNDAEQVSVLKLLEMQRHAMLMFTSCGWFFDDISGIETVQVLQYAGRVIQLAQELFNDTLEPRFLEMLAQAKSNIPKHRNGAHIYEKFVKPAMVNLPKVGAHYAISSLFEKFGERTRIFSYTVDRKDNKVLEAGKAKLVAGQAQVTSQITRESVKLSYAVAHFGDHNVSGGVQEFKGEKAYQEMVQKVGDAFSRVDIPEVIRLLDQYFKEGEIYSLKQLFRDQQHKIINLILNSTLAELEADYRRIYERHVSLMRFLKELGIPLPHALLCAADFYLNSSLRRSLSSETIDKERVAALLNEAKTFDVKLDAEGLSYVLKRTMEQMAEKLRSNTADLSLLEKLNIAIDLARSLPFEVDLWKIQNIYYRLLKTVYPDLRGKMEQDESARVWVDFFSELGKKLQVQGIL